MSNKFWCVSIYEIDRAYGGREEGGWWFDYGQPCEDKEAAMMLRVFDDHDEAFEYRDSIEDKVSEMNEKQGRREPGSVLCGGYLVAYVQDHLPKPFPEETPTYE